MSTLARVKRIEIPLLSVAEIRLLEKQLFTQATGFTVMQQAGLALYHEISRDHPEPLPKQTVHIVIGAGNNAGDGLVLACLLKQGGFLVKVYQVFDQPFEGDAAKAYFVAKKHAITWLCLSQFSCQASDIIVDAIIGIGLDRVLTGQAEKALQAINKNRKKHSEISVYSVDVPTGLLADTGAVLSEAVYADKTVTFIADKIGLHTGSGPAYAGQVKVITLGAEALPLYKQFAAQRYHYVSLPWCTKSNTHKGDYGHTLTVGGGQGMFGAAALSAISALKVGSGKSSLYSHADYASQYHINKTPLYEVMRCLSIDDLSAYSAVVLGPGLGRDQWGLQIFQQTLARLTDKTRLLLDADGLYHLANSIGTLPAFSIAVITPHEAEAARLLQCRVEEIRTNKPASVKALANRYRCLAVLKGAGTLISDGENLWVNTCGNVNLATGGTGDVLAGMIGGYLSQNYTVIEAVLTAVYFHGMAADRYLKVKQRKSMRASDLWQFL